MSALDQLESLLQGLMERPAGLLTPKGLQPIQLASALTKALEERALRLTDRIVIPNHYVLSIAAKDFAQINPLRTTLERELAEYVERLAAEREVSLPADPEVRIQADARLAQGRTSVDASFSSLAAPPPRASTSEATGPSLALLGGDGRSVRRFRLDRPMMTLGRRSSNDIPLPDLKVSRRHARFDVDGTGCYLTDLGSTNGTRLNGRDSVQRSRLQPGDIIEVGLQRLRFDA